MHLEAAELNGEKVGVDIQTISCCKDSTAVEGIARYSISERFVLVTIQIKSTDIFNGCSYRSLCRTLTQNYQLPVEAIFPIICYGYHIALFIFT